MDHSGRKLRLARPRFECVCQVGQVWRQTAADITSFLQCSKLCYFPGVWCHIDAFTNQCSVQRCRLAIPRGPGLLRVPARNTISTLHQVPVLRRYRNAGSSAPSNILQKRHFPCPLCLASHEHFFIRNQHTRSDMDFQGDRESSCDKIINQSSKSILMRLILIDWFHWLIDGRPCMLLF